MPRVGRGAAAATTRIIPRDGRGDDAATTRIFRGTVAGIFRGTVAALSTNVCSSEVFSEERAPEIPLRPADPVRLRHPLAVDDVEPNVEAAPPETRALAVERPQRRPQRGRHGLFPTRAEVLPFPETPRLPRAPLRARPARRASAGRRALAS